MQQLPRTQLDWRVRAANFRLSTCHQGERLKEAGASGKISLGKRFAGQLFEVTFHNDGRVEMLHMQAVLARRTGAGGAGDLTAPDAWLPPGGYDACNAWALENRHALKAYAQRLEQDGTATEQFLRYE